MFELIELALQASEQAGYTGVMLLMTLESSFIPFPSEVIIAPAAYLASQGEMNLYLIILFGILGSLIGAIINYFLAFYLGRAIVYRLAGHRRARWFLVDDRKVKKAEDFFIKYGGLSTFIGRLLPVIRQLISLPAGFSRMNFSKFVVLTGLGSAIWVSILAFLGYLFGANQEAIMVYYKQISLFFLVLVLLVFSFFVIKKYRRKKREKK